MVCQHQSDITQAKYKKQQLKKNIIMRNATDNCNYRYVNLLQYKQLSLIHVSATYCGHLQVGGVIIIIIIITQNVKF